MRSDLNFTISGAARLIVGHDGGNLNIHWNTKYNGISEFTRMRYTLMCNWVNIHVWVKMCFCVNISRGMGLVWGLGVWVLGYGAGLSQFITNVCFWKELYCKMTYNSLLGCVKSWTKSMCYFQHRFFNGNINWVYKTIPSISQPINRRCIEELSSVYITVYTILFAAKHIYGDIKPNCPHDNVDSFRASNKISISSKSCLHFPIRRVNLVSVSEAIAVCFFSNNDGGTFSPIKSLQVNRNIARQEHPAIVKYLPRMCTNIIIFILIVIKSGLQNITS